MKKSLLLALLVAVCAPSIVSSAEPRVLLVGIWPNRMQFLDEESLEVVSEFPLRHGAVVWDSAGYSRTAHTPDFSRLYFITGTMETLEIVDVARHEVVDEVKLSTPERKVRFMGAAPMPDGKRLYLTVRNTDVRQDRFFHDRMKDIAVFNLETREVEESFPLADLIGAGELPGLWVAPDGNSLFAPGKDIFEISRETHDVVGTIAVKNAGMAGYGPRSAALWFETEPGVYRAAYFTRDPVMERSTMGMFRFDVRTRRLTSFEMGPAMNLSQVALSPDGKRAYIGGNDLVVVDMETHRILARREGFERGRANTGWIVSADGTKLYVGGVGDRIKIYDGSSLELLEEKVLAGDSMFAPIPLPRSLIEGTSQ